MVAAAGCAHPAPAAPEVPPAGTPGAAAPGTTRLAVIGDLPYDKAELKALPGWIDDINSAHPVVTFHLGDTKAGDQKCSRDYFETIREQFDRVQGALVFTPGDNDWADCHHEKAGRHDPLDRLDLVRRVFFPQPGTTLGQAPLTVTSYANRGLPENVTFALASVRVVVVHLVGSGDGLDPWTGLGKRHPTPVQRAEEAGRVTGAVAAISDGFAQASRENATAVMVLTQADLFRSEAPVEQWRPVIEALIDGDEAFGGQVLLVNGDTHTFVDGDHPLAPGSRGLATYGVRGSSDLARVVIDGDQNAKKAWLLMTIDPSGPNPISWRRVGY